MPVELAERVGHNLLDNAVQKVVFVAHMPVGWHVLNRSSCAGPIATARAVRDHAPASEARLGLSGGHLKVGAGQR
jgi:hypothetical protein